MVNGCKWVAKIKHLILIGSVFLLATVNAQIEVPTTWNSALYVEHALVGKIWRSKDDQFIGVDELVAAIDRSSYLLLGEKHDNPDHHNLQGLILGELLTRGNVSSIAFEMLDSKAQPALDDIKSQQAMTLDDLKSYLDWDEAGWDWDFYGPLLMASYQSGTRLIGANIDAETMGQVYSGNAPLDTSRILDELTVTQLNLDIDESHCGLLPASQFPAMVRVQQARDHSMASSLGAGVEEEIGILVAGNYHIRQDLGVPKYLLAQNSDLAKERIVALAFIEVDPEVSDAGSYLEQFGNVMAYDYIWFTPAISDEDYCASMQQQLQ